MNSPCNVHAACQALGTCEDLAQSAGANLKETVVGLRFRSVYATSHGVEIIHHGCFESLTEVHRHWLKRKQAIETIFGHLKNDDRTKPIVIFDGASYAKRVSAGDPQIVVACH